MQRVRGRESVVRRDRGSRRTEARALARTVCTSRSPKRAWSELVFFLLSSAAGRRRPRVRRASPWSAGLVLAITFFGLAVLALSLRSARGIGGFARGPGPQPARRARSRTPSPSSAGPGSSAGSSRPARPRRLAGRRLPRRSRCRWRSSASGAPSACGGTPSPASSIPSSAGTAAARRCSGSAANLFRPGYFSVGDDRASSTDVAIFISRGPLLLRGPVGHAGLRLRRPAADPRPCSAPTP